MRLRESSEEADVEAAVRNASTTGVEHGDAIMAYLIAVLDRHERTAQARDLLVDRVGAAAAGDAAAVIAFFDAINRVADATGTVLDDYVKDRYR